MQTIISRSTETHDLAERGFSAQRVTSGGTMKANVFHGKNEIRVEEVEKPRAGVGEAVMRVTLTTICGTDLHIVRGEYPIKPGLIIGHEAVGVIEELGEGLSGYHTFPMLISFLVSDQTEY